MGNDEDIKSRLNLADQIIQEYIRTNRTNEETLRNLVLAIRELSGRVEQGSDKYDDIVETIEKLTERFEKEISVAQDGGRKQLDSQSQLIVQTMTNTIGIFIDQAKKSLDDHSNNLARNVDTKLDAASSKLTTSFDDAIKKKELKDSEVVSKLNTKLISWLLILIVVLVGAVLAFVGIKLTIPTVPEVPGQSAH